MSTKEYSSRRSLRSPILILAFLSSTFSVSFAGATDIIVDTTSDVADFGGAQTIGDLPGPDGLVALREAIIAANNTAGPQVVGFNIPTGDPGFDGTAFTTRPLTSLPGLTGGGTTIDGATQTAFSGDTNLVGPEIVINGSLAPIGQDGLSVSSSQNRIRHLVINDFPGIGVAIDGSDNALEDDFVGTNVTGSAPAPNTDFGVLLFGTNHLVKGNLISGNMDNGIAMGETANGCLIQENRIGTDIGGTLPLPNGPNGGAGIQINGSVNNTIKSNRIAFNNSDGVAVAFFGTVNNTISRNSIFSNDGHGIDLGFDFHGDGVTPNDPGDTDAGPNDLMNFPVLASALATARKLVVTGTIDTPNPRTVIVEFFGNPAPDPGGDPSGHGEGAIYLGSDSANSRGKFTATLLPVAPGTLISATATDAAGNTSEFSANIEAKAPGRAEED